MSKCKDFISASELEFIEAQESMIENIIKAVTEVGRFNLGDYLIGYREEYHYDRKTQQEKEEYVVIKNSYGVTKKFKVVYVDKNNVPYIRELNRAGKPIGPLESMIDYDTEDGIVIAQMRNKYELDPEYADALILGEVDKYNPVESHQKNAKVSADIAEYNKSIKIPTFKGTKDVIDFVKTLKVGDLYWKSNRTSWLFTEIGQIPMYAKRPDEYTKFIKVKTTKGELLELCISDIWRKGAFYKDRPRTYKELKDPK